MDSSGRRTVAGVFKDEAAAASAVKKLVEAHFDPESDVSVIASHRHERESVPVAASFQVVRMAGIGALVGAIAAAAGSALSGLAFGPFTMETAGPLMAALEMAYVGGCLGFALGALVSMDLSRAGADFQRSRVHGGVVWVGVQAGSTRARRAMEIMREAGARHFMDARPRLAHATA